MTRRCRYTHVAPEYAIVEPALTMDWISRREVFNIAATLAASDRALQEAPRLPIPPPPQLPPQQPLTSTIPAETRTPFRVLLLIFLGIVSLIPILCACLAVLALAPGMSQTRQMIAAANIPSPVVTQTIDVADVASVISLTLTPPLTSPLTPTPSLTTIGTVTDSQIQPAVPVLQRTTTPTVRPLATVTVGARPVITPITPLRSPLETPTPFNALLTPAANRTAIPGLPATFTPIPTGPIVVLSPTPTAAGTETVTLTATPILVIVVTATVTPLPSPTPNGLPVVVISSSVVISNVMYAGTPALSMSDQYIEVQNRGSGPVSIGNWRIHAESANRDFYFTNGLVLLPSQTCRVYGSSPPANASGCGSFSFNSSTPVWSPVVDAASLYDEKGEMAGSYVYNTQR